MEPLFLSEISDAVGGRIADAFKNTVITGVSTNSKTIYEGALFIPIVGETHDGHDFIAEAVQKGASAFIASNERAGVQAPHILVKDTRRALADLAAYYRNLFKIPVIAVTGSVGKTSVKNSIAAVLGQRLNVLKTEGNFNNDIGLPLTVFKLDKSHEAAVLEMGMNNFGEISLLSRIAKPDTAVITNVGTAHIENLGSREGILRAKLEVLDGMNANGTLILNYDNDMLKTLKDRLEQKTVWVSVCEEVDVYAKNIMLTKGGFSLCHNGIVTNISMPIAEPPLITNALMAAAVGFVLGLSADKIKKGIETGVSEKARLELYKTKSGGIIINDCYNANPDSMKLALDALSRYNMEKIAILGDMFEQGGFAPALHREIGEYAFKSGVSLIAVGKDAKYYNEAFDSISDGGTESYYFENKQDLFNAGFDFSGEKAVLIKASRGMRFEDVFEWLAGNDTLSTEKRGN